MIVVIGLPAYLASADGEGTAGGLAVDVARTAAARGSQVQLVGKVGDDGAGDAVVVALGRLGIGHSALLRDPVHPTPVLTQVEATVDEATVDEDAAETEGGDVVLLPADAAERPALDGGDVALALGYLEGARVIVTEPLPESALAALVEGAAFSGAASVVLVKSGTKLPSLPPETTILEAPAVDDGSFGRLVGEYAAGLDSGLLPAQAFESAVTASGWEAAAT